jgi:hypothetical protein
MRDRTSGLRRHVPLAPLLAAQAAVYFLRLDLLPAWMDELHTVQLAALPGREIGRAVAADVHPPLYFLLAHLWPWHSLEGLRGLSVIWALAATLLLDLCWTRHWRPARRWTALALFAFSPCLLLYGRMARSYSMQTALAVLAVFLLWRWARGRGGVLPAAAACCLLLYTHYVPGLALTGAFTAIAWRRSGGRAAAPLPALTAAGCLPWLAAFGSALGKWGEAASYSASYYLTGSAWLEVPVKAAFGGVSLALGESFHPVSLLAVPLIAWAAWRGIRGAQAQLAWGMVAAAVVGFAGVARWVSYPFTPARLLWALPFLCLAITIGLRGRGRWAAVTLLGCSGAASTIFYFRNENYLNHGYQAPVREIAERLKTEAAAEDAVLLDRYNTDDAALAHYYPGPAAVYRIGPDAVAQTARAKAIWIVRNQYDASPGRESSRVEAQVCASRRAEVSRYLPYPGWQRWLLGRLAERPPTHFYQVTACR